MVKKATLKSGVTVVMEPLDYVGSCALGIWVKTGSVNETADNSGISHFIEHMMFKGTARRDARKIAAGRPGSRSPCRRRRTPRGTAPASGPATGPAGRRAWSRRR